MSQETQRVLITDSLDTVPLNYIFTRNS